MNLLFSDLVEQKFFTDLNDFSQFKNLTVLILSSHMVCNITKKVDIR